MGTGATVSTSNTISGGAGGAGGAGATFGGAGGAGAFGLTMAGTGSSVTSGGTISGGAGGAGGDGGTTGGDGGAGAEGLNLGADATVTTSGAIIGGAGGAGGSGGTTGGNGGDGAIALDLGTGATITSSGSIIGGSGGAATAANGNGGNGADAIHVSQATITNAGGQIIGGSGGAGFGSGTSGTAGVGILGSDLTVVTSGLIAGGLAGDGVTRANAITFTGGTNSLELQSGFSFKGRVVDTTGDGTLILGGAKTADDTSLDASTIGAGQQYDGFSSLKKTGMSTWTLRGTNTDALPVDVEQGNLSVTGSLPNGTFSVEDATLSGTGMVGSANLRGGTLSPGTAGNPYGTLSVNTTLTFSSTSRYAVSITPDGQTSLTKVGGVATLNGATVGVTAASGRYVRAKRYTILTAAGGVSGTFQPLDLTLGQLKPTLTYDSSDVYIAMPPANPVKGTKIPDYRVAAATLNQLAVAGGLTNAALLNHDSGKIFKALNQLTNDQARATFDTLSGEGITAAQNVASRSSQLFTSAMFDQTTFYGSGKTGNSITLTAPRPSGFLAYAPQRELGDASPLRADPPAAPARTWRAWGSGFGGIETVHGSSWPVGSVAQGGTVYGGAMGVDDQVTPSFLLGVALGGSNGAFSVPGRATSGTTNGGHVAIYNLATFGRFYGATATSASFYGNQATRDVPGFGGLAGETERATFGSHELRARVEFGRHVDVHGASVTPFVAMELATLRSNGFHETALSGPGLLVLDVSGQTAASVPSFVGARFARAVEIGGGIVVSPTLEVSYVHEFAPQHSAFGTLVNLPGSTFLVNGAQADRNAAKLKAGGTMALGNRAALFATFDSEFSGTSQFYTGMSGFQYLW